MCVILNEKNRNRKEGDVLVSTIQKKREREGEKEWADLLWVKEWWWWWKN